MIRRVARAVWWVVALVTTVVRTVLVVLVSVLFGWRYGSR